MKGSVQAIILAGGLGTRLRTVVNDRPKTMACFAGKPFLEYQIAYLKRHQIDQIILSVVPLRLNTGTLLFEKGEVPSTFKLNSSVEFQSGLIQNTYTKAIV